MGKIFILKQPKFFKDFSCIGGACPQSCCEHWGAIFWKQEEYDKLCAADMSENLRKVIEDSFIPLEENSRYGKGYSIKLPNGRCPMLTETSLCSIQKELGAEYLSHTCNVFPRVYYYSKGITTRTCSISCIQVLRMLLEDKEAMKIENYQQTADEINKIGSNINNVQEQKETAATNFRNIILDFVYNILSDEKYSVETGMVLGALAIKKLNEFSEDSDKIPEVIKTLSKQLRTTDQIQQIESINTNYNIKLGVMSKLFFLLSTGENIANVMGVLFKDGDLQVDRYEKGERMLNELFKDKEYFFRNMALNTLIEVRFPFFDIKYNMYDNWLYYCAVYSMTKLLCCAAAYNSNDRGYVLECIASFNRQWGHHLYSLENTIKFLKQADCTKMGHIACMLK